VLAAWRPLLEPTVLQQGEPFLGATARPQEVWLSAGEASRLSVTDGHMMTVTGTTGSVTAPLVVGEVADGTVVVTGDAHRTLGSGQRVRVIAGGRAGGMT
jgi:anaerobic selenocysteine-containing dehydrogenase